MKILVATGQKELDQFLRKLVHSPLPLVAYKEGVQTLCERDKPDVVILSAFLDGNIKMKDLLYVLRKNGARVVVLIGHTEPNEIRSDWIPLGVYDYITDPVTEEKIRLSLEYPATLGMAEEKLQQIDIAEIEEKVNKEQKPKSFLKREKKKEKNKEAPKLKKKGTQPEQPAGGAQWAFEKDDAPEQENPTQTVLEPVVHHRNIHEEKQPQKTWSFEVPVQEEQISNKNEVKPKEKDHAYFPEKQQKTSEQNHQGQPKREENTQEGGSSEKNRKERLKKPEKMQTGEFKKQEKPQPDPDPKLQDKGQSAFSAHKETKSVWEFQKPEPSLDLPAGYNIVVLSPAPVGKTYIAANLAATLSKQGAKTELVAFEGYDDIWQYLDLPMMEAGTPQGLPNLTVTPFKKMLGDSQYRIIDLPSDEWDQAKNWHDALFLYVTDMDVVHHRQAMRLKEVWQGRKVLQVLNRFVSNVLDSGQEQKIRLSADIVFNDQPDHFLAMRFGRPVIATNQLAAREYEMAAKTVQEALPKSNQNNLYTINRSS